jgi:glycosyltransferase involved in cell wall biosynthesis
MVTIIIPSRNEPYLNETLRDLLKKAKGEFEIIVTIDDKWPDEVIKDTRITYLHPSKPEGMRAGINAGLALASGKYIMKVDAHCLFAEGFDEIMVRDMQEDWLMIPRRYSLYADGWKREDRMPIKDYHYIHYPIKHDKKGWFMTPQEWRERTYERMDKPEYMIDDTMSFQGSFWFADREFFMKTVGYLDDSDDTYTSFSGEQHEVGLKYWLKGGQVKVNKNTWYAHLFKNLNYYTNIAKVRDRGYKKDILANAGWEWTTKHWLNNEEKGIIHPFSWLLEKFWPVPTWPEDKKLWKI